MTHEFFEIRHLKLLTGLSERTIRSDLASGLLEGEKVNGTWRFTPEQVDRFLSHPAVRPGIQAKQNAVVYDFLSENQKSRPALCVILDLPGAKEAGLAEDFCREISSGPYTDLQFTFDGLSPTPRLILRGDPAQVLTLLQDSSVHFPE